MSLALPPLELIDAELASRSLHEFVLQAWPIAEPGKPFLDNWHIEAICEHLEAVTRGEIRRLLINVPFRTAKSTLTSVMWPAWTWVNRPEHQWLCGSYAAKLAIRDNLRMRRLITSPWYQDRWGERFQLTGDQNSKIRFENDRAGYRIAFGLDGGVMGEGGDTVVVDDPHDRNQAHSDAERENAIVTFDEGVATRLNDPESSAIVIIMQRLHEDDLSGHLLARGSYEHLLIPMHYDPKRARVTITGWQDPRTVPGELMHPDRFPAETVKEIERAIGSYAAAGQLEQSPSPPEGGMLKRGWWQFYRALPTFDETCQSWDLTFKDSDGTDRVAGQAWGREGANFYLFDLLADRMDFPTTCRTLELFSKKHPLPAKLVEDKANGPAVIATLKDKIPGLIAVEPDGSKVARAAAVAPYIEAGNVFLPDPEAFPMLAPLVFDFIEECAKFPMGSHDDQVDAMSQAIHRLKNGIGQGYSVVSFYDNFVRKQANAS